MGYSPRPAPFLAFTRSYTGIVDRIYFPVKISKPFLPVNPLTEPLLDFMALLDTGASKSVIRPETAKKLGLIPTGTANIRHAGGDETTHVYLVNLFLPNMVAFPGLQVYECSDGAGDFGAIVGMDIISRGDLSITNLDNKTLVSFRIPSYKVHDYVVESLRLQFPGIKQFAPCPCGAKNGNGTPIRFFECHGKLLFQDKANK
jgi:hypothetical protein